MSRSLLALAILTVLPSSSVIAQPVPSREGSSTHIFPAGGRRGTTVEVRVGAECIAPQTAFRVWGEGVSAPPLLGERVKASFEPSPRRKPTEIPVCYPKEWSSQIDIDDDAPLGPVYWRLTGAKGGTAARPFVIGDLPEFIETESNSVAERAEQVTLPVTINGQIAGERDADWFRFSVAAGEVVTCETVAGRIGSPLDPLLEIRDSRGRRIETTEIYAGSDPVLKFRAGEAGDYLLRVSNVGEKGSPSHVYRITVSTKPYATTAFPAASRPDELIRLIDDETHRTAGTALALTLPVTVQGRFLTAQDEDWCRFAARKGEWFDIACQPPPGSEAMPVIELFTEKGDRLASVSSAETAGKPCAIDWMAPADGVYRLRFRDLQHGIRGGDTFVYRASVRPAPPDFSLALKSDFVNVVQGAKTILELTVRRTGGFNGPIDLSVEGLPAGVTLENPQIPAGQSDWKLSFAAADSALSNAASLTITGRAKVAGTLRVPSAAPTDEVVTRTALAPHLGVDAEGVVLAAPTVEHVLLTVQHKPVFRLFCAEAYQYAHRGTVYPYLMEIERLDGFDGEVVLQIGDRQNRDLDGVEMFELRIPPGQTQGYMPIYFPETMHINIQSQSQLYVQGYALFADAVGRKQSQLVVSEKRCLLRTLPTVVKLQAVAPEAVAPASGGVLRCRMRLERTTNFPGPMKLELVATASTNGFTAEPVEIPAGAEQAEIVVRVPPNALRSPAGTPLTFRATGRLDTGAMVVSEARCLVR